MQRSPDITPGQWAVLRVMITVPGGMLRACDPEMITMMFPLEKAGLVDIWVGGYGRQAVCSCRITIAGVLAVILSADAAGPRSLHGTWIRS